MSSIEDVARSQADPVYMKTKAEIVEHFRETGGKNWTSAAASALAGTSDKKSLAYKAAIRQFQGKRLEQSGAKLAPKFEAVGKQLPPSSYTPKENSVTITIQATQKAGGMKGGTRDREFTATFTGPDAYKFVNQPTLRDILEAQGNYPDDVIDMLVGDYDGDGEDNEYELDGVSAS